MILTGKVARRSDAERTKDDANAVLVKQDRRAGTGMAHGKTKTKGVEQDKNEAAKLLQQFSGTPRSGKHRLHLRASLTGSPPKRKIYFSLNFCRRLNVRKKKLHREPTKNYFPLPNGIYQLGLSAGAIAIYGYLFYIENRETYQCHASYATIGNAVGMSRNTVRKYVQELERRGLILTERTTIITRDGRIQNGSLLYTILPIQLVIEQFYQEQFKTADIAREQQRIERLMAQGS